MQTGSVLTEFTETCPTARRIATARLSGRSGSGVANGLDQLSWAPPKSALRLALHPDKRRPRQGGQLAQTEPVHIGEDRLVIHNLVKHDPSAGFAEDVRKGLSSETKRLLPKYFYDELGSLLFDAICLLPEYYLTRAENEIIERYADEIASSVEG
ncbi:MAG: L-histidine N(alpha)-methyltransferase, partial [Pyrinomonadaceae bacterium]|nr:L-histidine N(alpha)-methyltransferase [Pyrinomonadaceae bacterium]